MRSDSEPGVQKPRTFIERARREQIVGCAIATIAELGYDQASLARIAERAGVSKGVIAYHFAGKDELIREVVAEVMARATEYIQPYLSAETTGSGILRAYIEAHMAFMGDYRDHLISVVEIARNRRSPADGTGLDSAVLETAVATLAELLARFQEKGEFRADLNPVVTAMAIRAAIDAVPRRLAREPGLDLAHYGRELADIFDLATRRPQKGEN